MKVIGTMIGGIIFLVLILIAAAIFLFVFWIMMLIDCAKRKFKEDSTKIVWILIIVLLHFLGAVIYYFAVKSEDKEKPGRKK